jgi:protein-tyrosine phosphatase
MPTAELRPRLAREGVFNTRDLGGLPVADGKVVAPRRLIRGDALHRVRHTAEDLRAHGVVRVLDLRDERERTADGILDTDGIEVLHLPVLDPTFNWVDDAHEDLSTLLQHRYRTILDSFADRFARSVSAVVEVTAASSPGAVAYHCAVGKDRTGLLTALLLGTLGAADEVIVEDYVRSARATAVQVNWLWIMGHPGGEAGDDDLDHGLWSARPATMQATLDWLRDTHGGAESYLRSAGVPADQLEELRRAVVVQPQR